MATKGNRLQIFLIYMTGIILSIYIKNSFLDHAYIEHSSILLDNLILVSIFATFLFTFSFIYNNNSFIDLAWGGLGILLIIDSIAEESKRFSFYTRLDKNELFVRISIISVILTYSLRHIFIYFRFFEEIPEDFRYIQFRQKFQDRPFLFWFFSYLFLHLSPLFMLTLAFHPVFDVLSYHTKKASYWMSLIGFILANFSILFETIADEQLFLFRKQKEEIKKKNPDIVSNVLSQGVWKYLRHPNYFGENLFFFSLVILNLGTRNSIEIENIIGFIATLSMFIFYSIPVIEKDLIEKYRQEYVSYQNRVTTKLIPLLY